MVDSESTRRCVYDETKVFELSRRIESMDLYDNVALLFSDLGKVMPYEYSHDGRVS